eukprot:TRINITY_DN37644_c0_g1_i1.p1 TRINITY_DN37644_c0_g1~~TRINITY_DN37644_c0_g1_i1.p1  ORF type:complete len:321 (-),score=51.98 TRINITY_DN37644_c0_g1_i1:619-1581(-)
MAGKLQNGSASSNSVAQPTIPVWHYFVAGALGDMTASLFSHPADVLKVRLQLTGECNPDQRRLSAQIFVATAKQLARKEGVSKGLYAGISASLARQSVFASFRHGLYRVFENRCKGESSKGIPTALQLVCAAAAGVFASAASNPLDVVLIRMQADGHWAEPQRRNYRHVFDGLARVSTEEGVAVLWRGYGPTAFRAALVTGSQIITYDKAKEFMRSAGFADDSRTHLMCAIMSATVACVVTSPVDVVKTRIMNASRTHGVSYKGPLDVVWQTARAEGPFGFYKGLSATFVRLWPHTVILWMVQERVKSKLLAYSGAQQSR